MQSLEEQLKDKNIVVPGENVARQIAKIQRLEAERALLSESHLGPECAPARHVWQTTEHGHDICVGCKAMRPTPSLKDTGDTDGKN